MNYRFVSGVLIASLLGASIAQAAVSVAAIDAVQGKVLVNHGAGFVALVDGAALNAGDRVMVGKDSAAVIAYANGCSVTVSEAKVVTVAKSAPCKAGSTAMIGSSFVSPVADVPGGAYMAPAAGFPLLLPLLGGAAVVGGGILLFNNNNSGCGLSGCAN
jgi:hypothetical protein